MGPAEKRAYQKLSVIALFVLSGGVIFYHFVEDLAWIDALYFCAVTLTTVGYGDITPQTDFGKLFTVFYLFIGVGIIAAFLNARLKHRAAEIKSKHQKKR